MKFKKEVQELFEKAGWYEGRDVSDVFMKIKAIDNYPNFLREFLFEYGGLSIETYKYNENEVTGVLNLNAIPLGYLIIDDCLTKLRGFGNDLYTFPVAYYHLDSATLEVDTKGNVYMASDAPTLMSTDFVTGIEKVIMEDYSDTHEWDYHDKRWKK